MGDHVSVNRDRYSGIWYSVLGILVLANADGVRSASGCNCGAVCCVPLATPACLSRDGGDIAVEVRRARCGKWARSWEVAIHGSRDGWLRVVVGIEAVAGIAKELVAGAGNSVVLTEARGCSDHMKDIEIFFGACCCSDVKELGGEGVGQWPGVGRAHSPGGRRGIRASVRENGTVGEP